jgi:hypothetical protein
LLDFALPTNCNSIAMDTYTIYVIREGREDDYRNFWGMGVKVNSHREILTAELVGFTESVEANTLNEAIAMVKKKYPTLIVAEDHSGNFT